MATVAGAPQQGAVSPASPPLFNVQKMLALGFVALCHPCLAVHPTGSASHHHTGLVRVAASHHSSLVAGTGAAADDFEHSEGAHAHAHARAHAHAHTAAAEEALAKMDVANRRAHDAAVHDALAKIDLSHRRAHASAELWKLVRICSTALVVSLHKEQGPDLDLEDPLFHYIKYFTFTAGGKLIKFTPVISSNSLQPFNEDFDEGSLYHLRFSGEEEEPGQKDNMYELYIEKEDPQGYLRGQTEGICGSEEYVIFKLYDPDRKKELDEEAMTKGSEGLCDKSNIKICTHAMSKEEDKEVEIGVVPEECKDEATDAEVCVGTDDTAAPTAEPTAPPSAGPSAAPSAPPSAGPSAAPSAPPSAGPSAEPTAPPSAGPSTAPSAPPSAGPSAEPSAPPSAGPSAEPTAPPGPSAEPTAPSSAGPSAAPSAPPSAGPSAGSSTGSGGSSGGSSVGGTAGAMGGPVELP